MVVNIKFLTIWRKTIFLVLQIIKPSFNWEVLFQCHVVNFKITEWQTTLTRFKLSWCKFLVLLPPVILKIYNMSSDQILNLHILYLLIHYSSRVCHFPPCYMMCTVTHVFSIEYFVSNDCVNVEKISAENDFKIDA